MSRKTSELQAEMDMESENNKKPRLPKRPDDPPPEGYRFSREVQALLISGGFAETLNWVVCDSFEEGGFWGKANKQEWKEKLRMLGPNAPIRVQITGSTFRIGGPLN